MSLLTTSIPACAAKRWTTGSNEAVDTGSLQAKVRALVANNPDVAVYVAADGAGSYQNVMDAMALLQNAGVERVGLMSQPRQDGTP